MIQIFVENPGKTLTIDVEHMSVDDLMVEVAERTNIPPPFTLVRKGGTGASLTGGTQLVTQLGVTKESTLVMKVTNPPLTYDEEVRPILAAKITEVLGQCAKKKTFVLVCLGSYDYGHDDKGDSIRQQQCPTGLLDKCAKEGYRVCILLVDPGFANKDHRPQIYDIDTKWKKTKSTTKVVSYEHEKALAELTTFATPVLTDEYGGKVPTLAGTNLATQFDRKSGSCLVVGNFYGTRKPYLALGDQGFISTIFSV